jgi:hypothetical protein
MLESQQNKVFKIHSLFVGAEILSQDQWNNFGIVEAGNTEDFKESVKFLDILSVSKANFIVFFQFSHQLFKGSR